MATKKPTAHKNLEWYDKMVAAFPEIERKGAGMPYTSLNGHMFSFMSKEGKIGIRLPEDEREAFLKKYKTELFKTHGTVLKEYVTVPGSLLKNTKELKKYFEISYELVKSLKPKPVTKKK
jgi:TfoX/Sxy family transcriptional regulator of competence genes